MFCFNKFNLLLAVEGMIGILSAKQFTHYLTGLVDFRDFVISVFFIALIHPIQWTIALPVGATGPAKCQKKTSCIEYRQDRSGECIRQVAHRTSSSCLDIVTS